MRKKSVKRKFGKITGCVDEVLVNRLWSPDSVEGMRLELNDIHFESRWKSKNVSQQTKDDRVAVGHAWLVL